MLGVRALGVRVLVTYSAWQITETHPKDKTCLTQWHEQNWQERQHNVF
jgi:hypothetical protein